MLFKDYPGSYIADYVEFVYVYTCMYKGYFCIYIFILITKWHRYREDIDTIIYNIFNIYTILEHRKTVS